MVFSLRSCRLAAVFLCLLLLGVTKAHATYSLTFEGVVRTLSTGGSITLNYPSGIVVDPAGDVFIADFINNLIVEVNAQGTASVLTISGLSPAALNNPSALAIDGAGNLYIADPSNNRVVKVSPSGAGSTISTGGLTLITPAGVALDQSGDLFIADHGNNRIVEVTPGGTATALTINVSSGSASLNLPLGLAVDVSGKLYIADYGNNRVVTVAAGSTTGVVKSVGELDPGLLQPIGVAVDRIGNVYIADSGHNRIVEVDTAGNGNILLNSLYLQGTTLSAPYGVALDNFGAVYVADSGHSRVLVVDPYIDADNGPYADLAAYNSSLNKSAVGFGHIPLGFVTPTSLILNFTIGSPVDGLGGVNVFTSGTQGLDFQIVSGQNTTCSSSTVGGTNCTVEVSFLPTAPGLRNGALVLYDPNSNPVLTVPLYGFGDAPVAALSPNTGTVVSTGGVALPFPFQIALDALGNIYSANNGGNLVKIPAGGGTASVVSASPYTFSSEVTGVAFDGAGNLFISDHLNSRIIVKRPGGVASLLTINGLGTPLGYPTALAFDGAGNLYISDYENGRIVEVSNLLVAGSTSVGIGTVIGTGSYVTSTTGITGVAVDPMGNIYIPDGYAGTDPSRVIKVTAAGVVSLLTPTGITFSRPEGVTADSMGNIYVNDGGNNRIVEITTAGVASVVAIKGLPSPTTLSDPFGVTLDPYGNLYIPDSGNNRVLFVNVSGSALTFPTTAQGATSAAQTATVTNLGNLPLIFSANPAYTANFIENSGDTNPCTSSTSLLQGTICDVSVEFNPQSVGSLTAGITVTNNALNVPGSTQQVSVSGTSFNPGDTTSTAVLISPTTLVRGQPATITATVSDTTSGHTSTHPTGSVTITDTVGSTTTTLNSGSPVTLSAGVATLTGVVLSGIGSHTITASYAGVTSTFLASNSSPASATLSKASVTVTGPNTQPVAVVNGQTGSVTVTVTAPYTTIAVPSGTFSYNILNSSSTSVASGTPTVIAGSGSSTATISIPNTLAPGNYTISVLYSGDSNYLVSATATTILVQVGQITPTLSWSPGTSSITYGTTLSGILNATAQYQETTIPGTFTYTATPTGGSASTVTSSTVLSARSYTLTATFTPTDTTTYKTVTTTAPLTVSQATPSITWATPAAITYGTVLGSTQLNASSTVAGTFAYTPVSGTVETTGQHTVSVIFTPTDTTDYSTAAAQVTLTVNQATPSITWATPAAISYGTVLGSAQLNASSTVPGTFVYTPTAGTVETAGQHTVSVTFTPTDTTDYATATQHVTLTVNQPTPSITWATPAAITYGTALGSAQLNASSTVPGTFVYTPASGTVVTAGQHTISVTFTPTDTTDYSTATAQITLTVNQPTPSITWTPAALTYGTALGSAQLNASSTVAGTFVYTPASGTVETGGQHTLSVTFTPTDTTDYSTATAQVTVTVNQATPTISIASSVNPVLVTNAVTFTATVGFTANDSSPAIETSRRVRSKLSGMAELSSKGPGSKILDTPTGSVRFLDGTTLLGSVALSSDTASYTTSSLVAATHKITAVYSGDANFASATSSAVSELVQDYSLSISGSSGSGGSGGSGSASSSASQTVVPGGTATYTLALGPSNGATFPAPITLSLSGLPPGATGTITPNTLPAGSSLTNVTLSIQLPQVTASLDRKQSPNRGIPPTLWSILLLPFAGRLRRAGKKLSKTFCFLLLLGASLVAMVGLSGCGSGNGFFGQQEGTYTVRVTATSGKLSHSTTVTLTVE
jgi:sugar lactone lactonase YvrE